MIEITTIRQIEQFLLKIEKSEVNKTDDLMTIEFFWVSHIDLTVSVERKKLTIENFWIWFFENSNICFDDVTNETKNDAIIVDFFVVLHIKLIALIEKWKFLTIFKISWLRICSYNFLLKLKFCLQNLQITRTHVTFWFNAFFIDFDMISSVAIEKFKQIDEMISKIVNEQNFENFWTKLFWCSDSNV